jgi:hypothetical protein
MPIGIIFVNINESNNSGEICPDCGGEVLINKYSGNGFCLECDYHNWIDI